MLEHSSVSLTVVMLSFVDGCLCSKARQTSLEQVHCMMTILCSVYLHLHDLTNYLLQFFLVLSSRAEERVLRQLTSNQGKAQKNKIKEQHMHK